MRLLPILILLPLLAGCATRSYRFDGVGADGSTGREVRYVLESESGQEGAITIRIKGRAYDKVGERETDTVRIVVVLDNMSDDAVEIPLDGVALKDDEGRTWNRVSVAAPADAPPTMMVGVARERTSYELLYDSGGPGALNTTGSVTFDWAYRFRGQETRHQSRFLPVRIERSHVYWSGGFWYGYGHHHLYWGPTWCW